MIVQRRAERGCEPAGDSSVRVPAGRRYPPKRGFAPSTIVGVDANAPIGVLAGDWAGLAAADAVQRRLPHEDVVYLADHAWAPYAGRPGAVVSDRVTRLAADLVEHYRCKLVLIASLQATLDGLEAARARLGAVPVIGLEPGPALARAAALAGGGDVRAVFGASCVRGDQLRRELRRGRDRSLPLGAAGPPDGAVAALLCAHACASPPADRAWVSAAELAAASASATVRGIGGAARRRRRGRRILVSSSPVARAAGQA